MNTVTAHASRRALVSVSDKTGVVDLARRLSVLGFEIISTGGTARLLGQEGISVTGVSSFTGFPEIMGGRVKTLHPRVHGGLLGRAGEDDAVMEQQEIPRIELAVINLYPFEEVTRKPDCSLAEAIENIDIGGPAMVRSAAKNYASVAVVTSPDQYEAVLGQLESAGSVDADFRFRLAVAAFNRIALYDAAISNYLSAIQGESGDAAGMAEEMEPEVEGKHQIGRHGFPGQFNAGFSKIMDLRYGENPHQQAAWFGDAGGAPSGLSSATLLQGKPLSYNNIADADAAWATAQSFDDRACVIVKHANPCGVALGDSNIDAYENAWATDSTSAFGGIIAFNRDLDEATARAIIERQFVELILAPAVTPEAASALAGKPNVRVLATGQASLRASLVKQLDFKRINGGLLVQSADSALVDRAGCKVVSRRQPGEAEWRDLLFAWRVARMVKSNAIVYAAGGRTLGIGAGQMSRVDSSRIARWKAGEAGLDLAGGAMASDAFFPFRDGIDTAAEAKIAAVIQPGGSMRDEEVIAAADENGMTMVFTGIRHFRH